MKKILLIGLTITISACSNHKNDVVGVESGGEYYALDHPAQAAVAKNNSKERLVCKRVQKTGSHFKTKRCTTESELRAEKQRATEILEERQLQETRKMTRSKRG